MDKRILKTHTNYTEFPHGAQINFLWLQIIIYVFQAKRKYSLQGGGWSKFQVKYTQFSRYLPHPRQNFWIREGEAQNFM